MLEYIPPLLSNDAPDDYESLPPTSSVSTHMMAGAMAGMMEHVIMYPLDSVKVSLLFSLGLLLFLISHFVLLQTRMQTLRPNPNASYRSVPEALYKMVRYEGVFRPIKGVSAVICSAGPAHALYYSCYEKMKETISGTNEAYKQTHLAHGRLTFDLSFSKTNSNNSLAPPCAGAAGCLATLLHDAVMNPAEVVKQRMQVYNSPYNSCTACMVDVFQTEGIRAFYRSYFTTLMMNIPFQSIHFVSYEFMQNIMNRKREYNPNAHVVSGAVAGGFAAAVTTPLDVCKTLINTQEKQILNASKQRSVTGLISAATTVYRCCGIKGYFQGLQARVLYSMPATAISWSVYEFLKYFISNSNKKNLNGSHSSSSNSANLNININLPKMPVSELSVKWMKHHMWSTFDGFLALFRSCI